MKEHQKDIDQLFREGLGEDRQYKIPDSYLDDLNGRLKTRRKKSFRGFILLTATLLLIGTVSALMVGNLGDQEEITKNPPDRSLQAMNHDSEASEDDQPELEPAEKTSVNYDSSTETISAKVDQEKTPSSATNTGENLNFNINNQHKEKTNDIKKSTERENSLNKKKEVDKGENKNINREKKTTDKEFEKAEDTSFTEKRENTKVDSSLVNSQNPEERAAVQVDSLVKKDDIALNENMVVTAEKDTAIPDHELDPNNVQNQPESDSTISEIHSTDSTANDPDITINNDPKPKKFSIEAMAFGGFDLASSKLIAPTTSESSLFNDNHKNGITGNYGLGVHFNFSNYFAGVGFSLNKYIDEIDYTTENYNPYSYDSLFMVTVDSIIYDTMGFPIDTIPYSYQDSITVSGVDTTYTGFSELHEYKLFAVPLTFGYTFALKGWAIRPRLSFVMEFTRAGVTGTYPLYNGVITTQTLSSIKFGMAIGLDVQVQKNFGDFFIFLRPGYRMRLTNVASGGSYQLKYNSFYTVLGVGYKF